MYHRYGRSTPEQKMIGGVVGMLVGVGIVCWAVWTLWESHATHSWPSTQGQIVESRIVTTRSSKGRTSTRAVLTYQYLVHGHSFTGANWSSCDAAPASAVGANPPGNAVTVFYDPDEPSRAVLVRGASSTPFLVLLAGLAFIGVSWWNCNVGAAASGAWGGSKNTGRLYHRPPVDYHPDPFLK